MFTYYLIDCIGGCRECSSDNMCDLCYSGYYYTENILGTFSCRSINLIKIGCTDYCYTCTTPNDCQSWYTGFYYDHESSLVKGISSQRI